MPIKTAERIADPFVSANRTGSVASHLLYICLHPGRCMRRFPKKPRSLRVQRYWHRLVYSSFLVYHCHDLKSYSCTWKMFVFTESIRFQLGISQLSITRMLISYQISDQPGMLGQWYSPYSKSKWTMVPTTHRTRSAVSEPDGDSRNQLAGPSYYDSYPLVI